MNTKQKYPMSMIFFHGLLAVLMIATLVVAWMMDDNKDLMPLHKSLGATVFIFGILRILNRMSNMAKLPPSVNHGALHWVEKAVHGLLMLVMLALPFVGWLMSLIWSIQGEQRPVPWLGDQFQAWFRGF